MDYEIVDFSLYDADVPSPTGKYVVRGDGIYLSGTNTKLLFIAIGIISEVGIMMRAE
ncbi:hypothetical protein [Candidatus Villigracilis affinis]|uniref:hypothetical protein n=1 Tax=Candidatus Villigracilis affinis TaxID=3140682 RepID=UPI001D939C13|nr:hypothetical protein [Anaerolineales bacterium]